MMLTMTNAGQGLPIPATSLYTQLQQTTKLWADTAELKEVIKFPGLAGVTTNPTIVWRAAKMPSYFSYFQEASIHVLREQEQRKREEGPQANAGEGPQADAGAGATATAVTAEMAANGPMMMNSGAGASLPPVGEMVEQLAVHFGVEALRRGPPGGQVCTQLDVRLADTSTMITKAHEILERYARAGVSSPQQRVLIKTPATWEGIRATKELERRGIRCLVTLVCSKTQGRAAAEAGATMLATYVGRVADWHAREAGRAEGEQFPPGEDPGVALTAAVHDGIRRAGLATEVMAASFRSAEQVAALAGRCDHLTVSPALLAELMRLPPRDGLLAGVGGAKVAAAAAAAAAAKGETAEAAGVSWAEEGPLDQKAFAWKLFRDKCGSLVTSRSVTGFLEDTRSLEMAFYKFVASTGSSR